MNSESLKIIKMMVDEGLTVEEIVNHFDFSESEILLISQYIEQFKENKE